MMDNNVLQAIYRDDHVDVVIHRVNEIIKDDERNYHFAIGSHKASFLVREGGYICYKELPFSPYTRRYKNPSASIA
jgi:hypothetical protein